MAKRRRWFRFSLRTLLVLTLAVALFLGLFTPRLRRARRQAEAIEALRSANETFPQRISFGYDLAWGSGRRASSSPPGPDWLRQWLGVELFADVVHIKWYAFKASSEDLAQLEEFTRLYELELSFPGGEQEHVITALGHICKLPHLSSLAIDGDVTDEAMEHLTRLENLGSLDLDCRFVTDEGLAQLAKLAHLSRLTLLSPSLDDEAVASLGRISPTTDIYIRSTPRTPPMTIPEMVAVESAVPNCRIDPLEKFRAQFIDMARQPNQMGRLRVFGSFYSADDLLALTRMRGISELCIDSIRAENASLDAVATMPWLQELIFWHADLDGIDLARLSGSKRLSRVAVVGPAKADVMATLANAKAVTEVLYQPSYETEITPEEVESALDVLATLAHLKSLVLAGPMIDDDDIARMQTALPEVSVRYAQIDRLPDIREAFAADVGDTGSGGAAGVGN